MKIMLGVLFLAASLLGMSGIEKMQAALAEVEQYYIPALFLSGHGPKEKAPQAFATFKEKWVAFTTQFEDELKTTPWKQAVEKINVQLQKAEHALNADKIFEAHRALEPVRNILAEVRETVGAPTIMDALTHFHDHMEVIMKTVRGKTPDKLTPDDIQKIQAHVQPALKAWQQVKFTETEKSLYRLSDEQVAYLNRAVEAEQKTLELLHTALKSNDKAAIIRQGQALRGGFITVFRALGKFDS